MSVSQQQQQQYNHQNDEVQFVAELRNTLPSKLIRTAYICTLGLNVGVPIKKSNSVEICSYLAYIFNHGTVFRSAKNKEESTEFDVLKPGQDMLMEFQHTDLNRKSYDWVVFGFENDRKAVKFYKPGCVTNVLTMFYEHKPFFLPETALYNVCRFFQITYGSCLVLEVRLSDSKRGFYIEKGVKKCHFMLVYLTVKKFARFLQSLFWTSKWQQGTIFCLKFLFYPPDLSAIGVRCRVL